MNHQRDNPVHQLKEFRKITLFHGEDSASLVTYYPDFLGLMNKYPEARLILITLRESAELARSLGVFDEVLVISQRSKIRYYLTGVYSLFKMVNSDLFIALDLTSRYSWVRFFSKFPFSRRTIRAEAAAKDRRNISFETADRLIREAGAEVALSSECFRHFRQVHNVPVLRFLQYRLGVGHSCPGSLKERMMSASTWAYLIQARLRECDSWTRSQVEVMFFGAASDYERAQDIIGLCTDDYPEVKFKNHCGKYTLNQTIRILSTLDEYWGVDNWLLQLSRLLRVRSVSFWGPTSPQERLRPIPDYQDQIQWMQLPCSPCVGKTEQPPCQGQNNCMWFDLAADKSSRTEPSFKWVSASRG